MSEITSLIEKIELSHLKLTRKRYFPNEEVDISGDKVIYLDENLLITAWEPIKPRDDMGEGVSYWFLDKGWKISKIFNKDGSFKHYYCDIVRYEVKKNEEYKVIDLLIDLVIQADGTYQILDLDELIEYYEKKVITEDEFMNALKNLNELISIINDGKFPLKELEMYN